jgi:hypothetical protein
LIWGLSRPESFVDGYMIHFHNNWQTTLPLWSKTLWLPHQDPHYWPRISARCINHGIITSAKDCANKLATDFWASVRKEEEEEEEDAPKSSIWQTEPRGWSFRCQRQPRKSVQEYRLRSHCNTASSTPKLISSFNTTSQNIIFQNSSYQNKKLITKCLYPRMYGYYLTHVIELWNIIWQFECKIYWFVVNPICFNNSRNTLLDGCICPYVINMSTINCCDFFKLKVSLSTSSSKF